VPMISTGCGSTHGFAPKLFMMFSDFISQRYGFPA